MPHCPDLTWGQVKAAGRLRYFEIVNARQRALFYERLLRYKALIRVCKQPRDEPELLRADFPDAWSKPSRWYYDYLLAEKRRLARDWMHGRPESPPVSNTLLHHILGGIHGGL